MRVFATLLVLSVGGLAAQGPAVQLEVTPSTIQLAASDSAQLVAVVRNNSASAIRNLEIHWFTDLGLTVQVPKITSAPINPNGTLVLPMTISQSVPGRTVGSVHLWVSYSTNDTATVPGMAIASLDVQERPALAVDKLVTVKLESAVDQLDENRSALLYIVVTNMAAVPVEVNKIDTYSPEFIKFSVPNIGSGISLAPQTSQVFRVQATVDDRAIAGNQRIVLAVYLGWTDAGRLRQGTLSVAQTLPVTIFGESDLLKLLGVPSFLFLPGFLWLTTFLLLWTRVAPKTTPVELTTPDKALIAVSLSFLATLVYPLFTGRNYLHGYGTHDVMMVWFGSIMFAISAWIAWMGIRSFWSHLRNWKQRRRIRQVTPTKNDSPLDMLVRMRLNGVRIPPQQVMAMLGGAEAARSFLVLPAKAEGQEVWVAPPIFIRQNPQARDAWPRQQLINELRKDHVTESSDQLVQVLRKAEAAGWIPVWGDSETIVGPTPVPAEAVTPADQQPGFEFVQVPA